eukprot:scaffold361_cov248-Pinguiococcus_pyrenoidosus.AAC.23
MQSPGGRIARPQVRTSWDPHHPGKAERMQRELRRRSFHAHASRPSRTRRSGDGGARDVGSACHQQVDPIASREFPHWEISRKQQAHRALRLSLRATSGCLPGQRRVLLGTPALHSTHGGFGALAALWRVWGTLWSCLEGSRPPPFPRHGNCSGPPPPPCALPRSTAGEGAREGSPRLPPAAGPLGGVLPVVDDCVRGLLARMLMWSGPQTTA